MKMIVYVIASMIVAKAGIAEATQFDSGSKQVSVLELFTSQGCSSCPPADRWLSRFSGNDALWEKVVPIAWHVDYWNRLGWDDPFAVPAYSQRQYSYYREGDVESVYTPGFVLNGEEWRGLHRGSALRLPQGEAPRLIVQLEDGVLTAKLDSDVDEILFLNVVLLGSGFSTEVKRGENRGRDLAEDFVALDHQEIKSNSSEWKAKLDLSPVASAPRYALAFWVRGQSSLKPIQATGGWIRQSELTASQ